MTPHLHESNINWLDNNDSEGRNLCNILETFGLVQCIELSTYQNCNILLPDSPVTASNIMVSDKISDHMTALWCVPRIASLPLHPGMS